MRLTAKKHEQMMSMALLAGVLALLFWQLGRQIVWPIITQSTLEVEQGTMIFAMMDEASADDDDHHHHLVDIPHHLLRQNHHRGGVTIVELLGARQVHHFILI